MGASDPVSAESSRTASSNNGTEECRESVDVEECVIRETADVTECHSGDRQHRGVVFERPTMCAEWHSRDRQRRGVSFRDRRCALPPNISFLLVELLARRTRV